MGVIGAAGIGITPPSPRTFQYGEQGTIEMKPMEDVVRSTLAPGGPQQAPSVQPTQPEQSGPPKLPDPYAMLGEEASRGEQWIESDFAAKESALLQKPQNQLKILEEEFEIQDEALQNKLGKRSEEYNAARNQLITQKEVAALRIEGKTRPERDQLNQQKQQALVELQKNTEAKKVELDTIKRLGDAGKLDPDAVLYEQLQAMGVNISLAEMRPPNARAKIRELEAAITLLYQRADLAGTMGKDFAKATLDSGDANLLEELEKELGNLRIQENPALAPIINRVKTSQVTKEMTGNKGGTIGSLLRSHGAASRIPMQQKTLDATMATTILNEANGDKVRARQIAKSRGYKF